MNTQFRMDFHEPDEDTNTCGMRVHRKVSGRWKHTRCGLQAFTVAVMIHERLGDIPFIASRTELPLCRVCAGKMSNEFISILV